MKNLTMGLALVAILAMPGTTLAEGIVHVSAPFVSTLVPGYDIYMLSVVNDEAYLGFIKIDGDVVQANTFVFEYPPPDYYPIEVVVPTVWNDNLLPPNAKEVDTHLLFRPGLRVNGDGIYLGQPVETNDKSLSADEEFYGFALGMGTFDMGGGMGFYHPLVSGTDFMQVVVPHGCGGSITISGYVAGVPHDVFWSVDLVPEPSTVLMLIAGGLCLLAVRPRRVSRSRI